MTIYNQGSYCVDLKISQKRVELRVIGRFDRRNRFAGQNDRDRSVWSSDSSAGFAGGPFARRDRAQRHGFRLGAQALHSRVKRVRIRL